MKREPLFLKPVFLDKIWGGTRLSSFFNTDLDSNNIGEAWLVSSHKDGMSVISNGQHQGKTLQQLWKNNKELFGNHPDSEFPLLIKLIDAKEDLSVQVHPDDNYAFKHEQEHGKNECWIVVDAEKDAEIVYGHRAKSLNEFKSMVKNNEWDKLLCSIKVKKNDFFLVPSGTIHAIGLGVFMFEVQQNSNITYRVYDYDRKDHQGYTRELHLEKVYDVTHIPHQIETVESTIKEHGNSSIETLISNQYFKVHRWFVKDETSFKQTQPYFSVFNVLSGEGNLNIDNKKYPLSQGDSALIPGFINEFSVSGNLEIIISEPGEK